MAPCAHLPSLGLAQAEEQRPGPEGGGSLRVGNNKVGTTCSL